MGDGREMASDDPRPECCVDATDLPGWTVQDDLRHLIGTGRMMT
jgi:hypothetical protein